MEKQRIKRYLNKKINPKVIALELGVSDEFVKECEKELALEAEKQQQKARTVPKSSVSTSLIKMQLLRDKYKKAYYPDGDKSKETTQAQTSKVKEPSKEELQEAERIITAIEQKTAQIGKGSNAEARKIAIAVIDDVKKLQPIQPLPLELAKRFKKATDSINIVRTSREDKVPAVIDNVKRMASERLVQAIDLFQQQSEDIEELRNIYKILTPDMERQNRISVGMLKSKLQRKIEEQQKKNALAKIKNIPHNIVGIVEGLANGDIDLLAAIQTIEEEAKSRVASRPQSRFAVTEKQEKRQIAVQILNAISENPDRYHFKNPEAAIGQIQELCGTDKGTTIRAMVTNLIGRKHFETAKKICRNFSGENQEETLAVYIRKLREDIKNAEVGEMVLRGINMKGTPEELAAYYEAIETGLKKAYVNPSEVPLGKNYDGTKNITLADIWLPEAKNKKGTNR